MEIILGTILVIIMTFYLLGKIGKLLLKYWIGKKLNNMSGSWGASFQNGSQQANRKESRREGEVYVDRQTSQTKRVNKEVGEYVDFEDVK